MTTPSRTSDGLARRGQSVSAAACVRRESPLCPLNSPTLALAVVRSLHETRSETLWKDRHATGPHDHPVPADAAPVRLGPAMARALRGGRGRSVGQPQGCCLHDRFLSAVIPAGRPLFATTAALALLQVFLETILYVSLAVGVSRAGGWFRRRTVRRRIDGASGAVLIGLGVRVALTSRESSRGTLPRLPVNRSWASPAFG